MSDKMRAKIFMLICTIVAVKCKDRHYYASMTAYEDGITLWNDNTTFQEPGCTPELFIMFARHGARNPNLQRITEFRKILLPLRDAIVDNILRGKSKLNGISLMNWMVNYRDEEEYQMVENGMEELIGIGQRYQERFPQLLSPTFDPRFHEIKHTIKNRTRYSAKALAKGIFGDYDVKTIVDDEFLRFYRSCKKWKETIDDTTIGFQETNRFRQSKVFKHLIKDVSKRLGFLQESELLSEDQIMAMFQSCRYDHVTQTDRNAPWCSVFTADDLEVIEYSDDMMFYWLDSYGYELNYLHACPPVKDIIHHISLAVAGNNEKKALFRVSHQGFMQKFFARLGLFEDERPLTASWWSSSAPVPTCNNSSEDNTDEADLHVEDRKLRISKISPLSANIVFVLYKCPEYKIKTFVQEHEIKLPKCSESPCSLEEFFNAYSSMAESCDDDRMEVCQT